MASLFNVGLASKLVFGLVISKKEKVLDFY